MNEQDKAFCQTMADEISEVLDIDTKRKALIYTGLIRAFNRGQLATIKSLKNEL